VTLYNENDRVREREIVSSLVPASDVSTIERRLSVAPMMEWTDRHCRAFHRLFAPHALLYTEMVTVGALMHGPRERLLAHTPEEQPVAFQVGGSDPEDLARCARWIEDAGFCEVNLNVGCPSGRVQRGAIGVCLMAEPERVGDCVRAMRSTVRVPVTVKCRLGIDDQDDYAFLVRFTSAVVDAGCSALIVHARKAILSGLTPAQNREIPPLDHARVHRLKRDFPDVTIVLNGGLNDIVHVVAHLDAVDGVMIGRAAYRNPWLLAELEHELYGTALPSSRRVVFDRYLPYVARELDGGTRLNDIARHLHGLFSGCRGAASYRRALSELSRASPAEVQQLVRAAELVDERSLSEVACSNV
jgi:tRNA-dihydrouridine synthase A